MIECLREACGTAKRELKHIQQLTERTNVRKLQSKPNGCAGFCALALVDLRTPLASGAPGEIAPAMGMDSHNFRDDFHYPLEPCLLLHL